MARTKQTARKDPGGKPLAMLKQKPKLQPKPQPAPKPRADQKVIVEYSSDEAEEEGEQQQQQGGGAAAQRHRIKKRIHLTLPTSPSHVTTTESFTTFFINHGLTRALRKAFEKRGWSTDQMREFIKNFQEKHKMNVPLPRIEGDEDTEDEGLELADGSKADAKSGPQPGTSAGGPARGSKRDRDYDPGEGPSKRQKTQPTPAAQPV